MKYNRFQPMTKYFIVVILIVSASVFLVNGKATVSAATQTPIYRYKLTWNITSVYYYVDSSATYFANPISKAAKNWVYTDYGWNNLYPNSRTYNIYNSTMDIYGYRTNDNANGFTVFFNRVNGTGKPYKVNPNSSNWLFAEIYLNKYYLSTATSGTTNYAQGVVAHEMGHAFGLGHNNTNPYSIMCQSASGRRVHTIQRVDHDAFNRKYR